VGAAPDPSGQSSAPGRIEARFEGDIQGPVAVANYGLQIGSNSGVVVNVLPEAERPAVNPKPGPIVLRGRAFAARDLLDRTTETAAARGALAAGRPVALFGPPGVGKTTLVRYLAWREGPAPTVGVLSYRPRQEPAETVDDLLQYVFEQFFDSSLPLKLVRTGASREHLEQLRALILLDDVALSDDDIRWFLDALPNCQIVLAATGARLSRQDGQPLAVAGLPLDAAPSLLERELGRPLTATEIPTATEICRALDGRPGELVELARLIEAEGATGPTLDAWLADLHARPTESDLTRKLLARLQEPERRTLSALVALSGATVRAEHVGLIAGIPDAERALGALVRHQLVDEDGAGYRVTESALAALPEATVVHPIAGGAGDVVPTAQPWDMLPWIERALDHFTAWAEEHRQAPDVLRADLGAVMRALSRAVELHRWRSVLRLGRAIEGESIVSGRWGAWEQTMGWMLHAARALGDRAAEAYALHQLGSRALCLGDAAAARASLEEALRLRRALGDRDGVSVTRHNLALLRPRLFWVPWALGSILPILALSVGIVLAGGGGTPSTPMVTPRASPTPTLATMVSGAVATPSPTRTPSRTVTPTATPTATRTPTPAVTLQPTLGVPGSTVVASGSWFGANRGITFTFNGQSLRTVGCSTNIKGSFSACSFSVPTFPAGSYAVIAGDGTRSASASFTVTRVLGLKGTSGTVGSSVTAYGSGFGASKGITLTFDTQRLTTRGPCVTNASGSISPCVFVVPGSPTGATTVTASDGTGSASASFTVIPALSLSPMAGQAGSTITANGSGFGASRGITFTFNATPPVAAKDAGPGCATDQMGYFSQCTFVVPGVGDGTYTVMASDGTNSAAVAGFSVYPIIR
jgi:hypothetical protein